MVATDPRLGQCSEVRMTLVPPTATLGRMPRLGQAGLLSRRAYSSAQEPGWEPKQQEFPGPCGRSSKGTVLSLVMTICFAWVFDPAMQGTRLVPGRALACRLAPGTLF